MSEIFDERESSFEAKYKLDEETRFKAQARRNRKFGLWVAERLGLDESDADDYARKVIEEDFKEPGDQDVIAMVAGDLMARGLTTSEAELAHRLDHFFAVAMNELGHEYPMPLDEDHHL
ncbi:DUF1476 domain-containing protein [Magnetospira thiophila]